MRAQATMGVAAAETHTVTLEGASAEQKWGATAAKRSGTVTIVDNNNASLGVETTGCDWPTGQMVR